MVKMFWLSGTYYPETESVTDGRTNGHEDPYIPPTLVEREYRKISVSKIISREHLGI